jgi:hypothetical protein
LIKCLIIAIIVSEIKKRDLKMKLLLDHLRKDAERRILSIETALKGTVMYKVAALDSQDCYGIFGVGNSTLENLEYLSCMLSTGLYDDAELGVVNSGGLWHVSYVGYDHDSYIDEGRILALLAEKPKQQEYYAANREAIENINTPFFSSPERKEWSMIGSLYTELLKSFMQPSDSNAINKAAKEKRDIMKKRIAEHKANKVK